MTRHMVFIGLALVALAVGFTVDVFVENSQSLDVDVLGRTFTVSPGWIVVAGIVALALAAVGARLIAVGVRRRRRRRAVLREAETAARDRDRLAEQLAAERDRNEPAERVRKEEVVAPVASSDDAPDSLPTAVD
jgi:hypothetical protein